LPTPTELLTQLKEAKLEAQRQCLEREPEAGRPSDRTLRLAAIKSLLNTKILMETLDAMSGTGTMMPATTIIGIIHH